MGSSDWMNRNIYRRIEVCFPIYNEELKNQLMSIISLQWNDTEKAVQINKDLKNISLRTIEKGIRSQEAIYHFLSKSITNTTHELLPTTK